MAGVSVRACAASGGLMSAGLPSVHDLEDRVAQFFFGVPFLRHDVSWRASHGDEDVATVAVDRTEPDGAQVEIGGAEEPEVVVVLAHFRRPFSDEERRDDLLREALSAKNGENQFVVLALADLRRGDHRDAVENEVLPTPWFRHRADDFLTEVIELERIERMRSRETVR